MIVEPAVVKVCVSVAIWPGWTVVPESWPFISPMPLPLIYLQFVLRLGSLRPPRKASWTTLSVFGKTNVTVLPLPSRRRRPVCRRCLA